MIDKTKSQKDKCKDVQLLQKLRNNKYVAFDIKDKEFTKRSLKTFKQKQKNFSNELKENFLVS